MSGGKPRPRNDSVDSAMIAAATSIVAGHDHRPERVGQDVAHHLARRSLAPSARAASTNSFSRSEKNCARTSRATGIQRKPPDHRRTIRMKTPTSGPNVAFSVSRNR